MTELGFTVTEQELLPNGVRLIKKFGFVVGLPVETTGTLGNDLIHIDAIVELKTHDQLLVLDHIVVAWEYPNCFRWRR